MIDPAHALNVLHPLGSRLPPRSDPGSLSSTTQLGTGSLATTPRRRRLALPAPTRSRTTPRLRTTGARTALPPPAPGRGAGTATGRSPALAAKTAASPPQRSSSRTTASDPPTAKGGLEPGCPCRRQTRAQSPSAGWYRSSPLRRTRSLLSGAKRGAEQRCQDPSAPLMHPGPPPEPSSP
jgi:hypothetical protein